MADVITKVDENNIKVARVIEQKVSYDLLLRKRKYYQDLLDDIDNQIRQADALGVKSVLAVAAEISVAPAPVEEVKQ